MPVIRGDRALRKRVDLTGQRFGKMTVLRPTENIGVKTAWVCRCDCGQETIVSTSSLRSGHTKSCGCAGGPRYALGLTYVDGTCVEMLRSKKIRKNNRSGVTGVNWVSRNRVWRATIYFKGTHYSLGSYHEFEDAVEARKRAEEELFEPVLREFAAAQTRDTIVEG